MASEKKIWRVEEVSEVDRKEIDEYNLESTKGEDRVSRKRW